MRERQSGGPERTRTSDLRFRKPLLYPAELRDQIIDILDSSTVSRVAQLALATHFATEPAYFGFAERFIAGCNSASSLSVASLCIVSVTCEYRSRVVVIVAWPKRS
jgi:hypothetical protein